VKRLLAVFVLMLSGITAFGAEADLVEGARQAIAYWDAIFSRCGGSEGQGRAWYAVNPNGSGAGSIQMVPELKIHFRTGRLSQEERLNGFEFKATISPEAGPFRWWIVENKAWRDWQVGEISPPVILIKKKGVWSTEVAPGRYEDRKALGACSQIPPMEEEKR